MLRPTKRKFLALQKSFSKIFFGGNPFFFGADFLTAFFATFLTAFFADFFFTAPTFLPAFFAVFLAAGCLVYHIAQACLTASIWVNFLFLAFSFLASA